MKKHLSLSSLNCRRHYEIIVNPASGNTTVDQKRHALAEAAAILNAGIHGLDTATPEDLSQCARQIADRCDILVIAGGDGTLSDIINAIDTSEKPIAFLPLGTGNAVRHALKYKGNLADTAARVRDGHIHEYDLINCDENRRAFMASMGIDGTVIRLRDHYRALGSAGFKTYLRAVLVSYFREYGRASAKMNLDGKTFMVENLLTLMVAKEPYCGFGMNVVPKAKFDDRKLHILCVNSGLWGSITAAATAFTVGNRIGQYHTGRQLTVQLERPLVLQVDGNQAWTEDTFRFAVLPKALKIKC
jgi:diacylglycerol kinase (ATP)